MQARDARSLLQARREEGLRRRCASGCARCSRSGAAAQRRDPARCCTASFSQLNAEFGFSLRARASRSTSTASTRELRADRAQLRPVPRPDAMRCAWRSRVHGAVPAHAAVQAARGVRERQRRARAVEQGGSAQVDAQLRERRRKASSAAARRSSASRRRPASSSAASPRSRRRTSACSSCSCACARATPRRCASTRRRAVRDRADAGRPGRCATLGDGDALHAAQAIGARVPRDRSRAGEPAAPAFAERVVAWQRDARPPRPAVAGHARPVPRLAVRDHAAADAGRDGARLLRALPRALPRRRARWPPRRSTTCSRCGAASATTAARATCTAARRWSSPSTAARSRARAPALADAARHRPLDRRGDRRVLLRRARRRSSTATSSACWRACSASTATWPSAARRARAVGAGAARCCRERRHRRATRRA